MNVDMKHHRYFVARRGEVLRNIAEEYGGVTVSFPRSGVKSERVIIKGSKDCVEGAKKKIADIVADLVSWQRFCLWLGGCLCVALLVYFVLYLWCYGIVCLFCFIDLSWERVCVWRSPWFNRIGWRGVKHQLNYLYMKKSLERCVCLMTVDCPERACRVDEDLKTQLPLTSHWHLTCSHYLMLCCWWQAFSLQDISPFLLLSSLEISSFFISFLLKVWNMKINGGS